MKGYKSAGFLLSLAASALADPYPSAVDMGTGLNARSQDLTLMGAMSGLHKRESILSLLKRGLETGDSSSHIIQLFPRQEVVSTPTNPKTGDTGKKDFDLEAWDKEVEAACSIPVGKLSGIVTKITDPAGVAVCYNIPYYDSATGAFASDIRLYKIANGTKDWEASGTKVSLSVQYQGATVRLAQAPVAADKNKVASASEIQAQSGKVKDTKEKSVQQAGKALDLERQKSRSSSKSAASATKAAAAKTGAPAAASVASVANKPASAAASKPASSAASKPASAAASKPASAAASAKPAQTPNTATLNKRMDMSGMAQMNGDDDDDDDDNNAFDVKLLQTMRFVGQVNPEIMKNKTMTKNPDIMKLVLTPSLMLIGVTADGNMNASVAAAQVQYETGAFSSIETPTPAPAPFVLPGVYISIYPLGLYLLIAYTVLFVVVVGWGTVERYLFRVSFRKRSAMMNGQDGFGKI